MSKGCLIYTSHLYGLGGGARAVIYIARAMSERMSTTIAWSIPPSLDVIDWLGPYLCDTLRIERYGSQRPEDYDVLWNIDHFRYITPSAKRNLAFVFFPRSDNVAPPQFSLFGVSQYTSDYVERLWEVPCETLYLPIDTKVAWQRKRPMILNVARFAAPSDYADKGHIYMIEAFKALVDNGLQWELWLMGGIDYGHGRFLDSLCSSVRGYPIRIVGNAPQSVVQDALAKAAIYWHPTGIGLPNEPGAQEHFGLSILEAMANGAVPIAINRGGPTEIIKSGYNGVLVNSPQELYDVTKTLMLSGSSWSLLSQRAERSVDHFMDWRSFVDRVWAAVEGWPIPDVSASRPWLTKQYGAKDVTIVIPVHNQVAYTVMCLAGIWQWTPDAKVVLVDNASTDETPSLQREIEAHGGVYLRREVNDGFASANIAAKPFCDRPFVLMMNNDVQPVEGCTEWLDILLAEMNDPSVGIVAPKLLFPNGTVQFAGTYYDKDSPSLFKHYGYGLPDAPCYNQRYEPIAVTGACLLCRRELFDIDSRLCLNYEDVAICLNARRAGFHVVYQPGAYLVHYEAATKRIVRESGEMIDRARAAFLEHYRDML